MVDRLQTSDTDPDVRAVVVARFRAMSVAERAAMTNELCRDAQSIAEAGIRHRWPDIDEVGVRREIVRRAYGRELADAVFGPR